MGHWVDLLEGVPNLLKTVANGDKPNNDMKMFSIWHNLFCSKYVFT